MTPEDYVRNNIMTEAAPPGSDAFAIQNKIAKECVDQFNRNDYASLYQMLDLARGRIRRYTPLARKVTAKQYAIALHIADSTARRWLSTMSWVKCDRFRKPFIYSLRKAGDDQ